MNKLFPNFDTTRHVVHTENANPDFPKFLSIVPGVRNPFVAQWWSLNTDNADLFMYREIYQSERSLNDNLVDVLSNSKDDRFLSIVLDMDDYTHEFGLVNHVLSGITDTFKKANMAMMDGILMIRGALAEGKLHFSNKALVKEDMRLRGFGFPRNTVQSLCHASYSESEKGIEFGYMTNGVEATIAAVNFSLLIDNLAPKEDEEWSDIPTIPPVEIPNEEKNDERPDKTE